MNDDKARQVFNWLRDLWALDALEIAREEINALLCKGVSDRIDRSDLESAAHAAMGEVLGESYGLVRLRIRSRLIDTVRSEPDHESLDETLPDGEQRELNRPLPNHNIAELDGDLSSLTKKQRRVYEMLAKGYTRTEVARVLGVTPTAVSGHVKAMRVRLRIKSLWSDFSNNPSPAELYRQATMLEDIGELRWSAFRDCKKPKQ